MTIKSASGREVKGKEALRGEKSDFICRVLIVLACEWGIDRGWKEGGEKAGEKTTTKERKK